MGYQRLTIDQARKFMAGDPARPAILSTTRKNGQPHAAPIWYDLDDDGTVCFNTGSETVKGRTLARTGWGALTVQDDRPPFSYVTVSGPVELIDDLDEVRAWAARIGGRYMGADQADAYGARNGVPGELLVRLTIQKHAGELNVAD